MRETIGTQPDLKILGDAETGEEAVELILERKPEIAILAIDLPGKDGLAVAKTIFCRDSEVKLIFLTHLNSEEHLNSALNMGAMGYVLKESPASSVIEAIREVSQGKNYISPVLSTYLINRDRRQDDMLEKNPAIANLTPCEKRIMVLVAQYMTSKEISEELFVSVRTVEHHRENIVEKLGLHGRYGLLKFALENFDNHH